MKYSITHNSYSELRDLYRNSQPRIGFQEVTDAIIQGFILSKFVWIRNFLYKLKQSGKCTRGIQARARANLGRNGRGFRKEENRLMQMRIGYLNREIRAQGHVATNQKDRVLKAFPP